MTGKVTFPQYSFIKKCLLNVSEYFKRQPIFISFAVTIFIQVIGTWLISAAYSYIPQMFKNLLDGQMTLVYSGINCLSSLLTTIQFWGIYLTRSSYWINFPKKDIIFLVLSTERH
jgi:hypothetical protein